MTTIPKDKWKIVKLDDKSAIRVTCPGCNCSGLLDHQVNSRGEVHPSLQCPEIDCDFHGYVKLEGYGDIINE